MKKDSCAGYICYPFANETFENILPRLSLLADSSEGEEHRNVCTCSSSIKAAGCYAATLSTQNFTLHRNASCEEQGSPTVSSLAKDQYRYRRGMICYVSI